LVPYIEHLFTCFGNDRLIWGSDWPVLTLASDYDAWRKLAETFVPTEAAKTAIFGANAFEAYWLPKQYGPSRN